MTTENQAVDQTSVNQPVPQPVIHERGEIGKGTPGSHVKALCWAHNEANKSRMHLKTFARQLAKNGNDNEKQLVKDWFDCKHGVLNAKRSDTNVASAAAAASATHQGRRKGSKS